MPTFVKKASGKTQSLVFSIPHCNKPACLPFPPSLGELEWAVILFAQEEIKVGSWHFSGVGEEEAKSIPLPSSHLYVGPDGTPLRQGRGGCTLSGHCCRRRGQLLIFSKWKGLAERLQRLSQCRISGKDRRCYWHLSCLQNTFILYGEEWTSRSLAEKDKPCGL